MIIRTRVGAGRSRALIALLIAIAPALIQACRTERPEDRPGVDTTATAHPPAPPPADTTAAHVDTALPGAP